MANLKTPGLGPELHEYLVAHGTPPDVLLEELDRTTHERFPDAAGMQIAPEQGALLTMLTRLLGVRHAVEVGTFTGYSATCIARGLAPDGRLVTLDVSEEFTSVAREFWARDGLEDRIELRLGDGVESLRAMPDEPRVDLAFVDAHKPQYIDYYEQLLPRLSERGVIVVDNVLWSGKVIDEDDQHEFTQAIRRFNDHVAADERSDAVMVPVADGLTFITRRGRVPG